MQCPHQTSLHTHQNTDNATQPRDGAPLADIHCAGVTLLKVAAGPDEERGGELDDETRKRTALGA